MTAKYPTVLDRSFRNFADYGKLSPISVRDDHCSQAAFYDR